MKSKIIIEENNKETHEYTALHQDRGFFTVRAETRICYSEITQIPGLHYEEVWDTDLNYYMDGKQVNWKGFKELYERLFGADSFRDFELNITEEFEAFACEHHRKKYKTLESLSKEQASEYMESLINEGGLSTNKFYCNNTHDKFYYTSDWLAKALCRKHDLYAIKKLNVPSSYSKDCDKAKLHEVVVFG